MRRLMIRPPFPGQRKRMAQAFGTKSDDRGAPSRAGDGARAGPRRTDTSKILAASDRNAGRQAHVSAVAAASRETQR